MSNSVDPTPGVVIHTGNILNINEVKRKAGQNPSEELVESLNYVMKNCSNVAPEEVLAGTAEVNKAADYLQLQLNTQDERRDVKVSVKVFVRNYDSATIKDALQAGFQSLNVTLIDSVVLALRGDENLPFETIQNAWLVLEEFVTLKKVLSIGVSDIETDCFIALYEWARVKPGIVQINLAHCCVVPPDLQSFTREHEVQLLTHSDPLNILPDSILRDETLGPQLSDLSFFWATRYQVHIKCRGVLTSKGYIVNLKKVDLE